MKFFLFSYIKIEKYTHHILLVILNILIFINLQFMFYFQQILIYNYLYLYGKIISNYN